MCFVATRSLERAERISWYSVQINDCSCAKRRKEKDSSLYRGHKLFLSKDWFEVVRVDYDVASIPLFRVDVLPSSESIQLGDKTTRTEPDDKVELEEVLGLLCLSLGHHLGSRKVLKVFMIHNNVDGIGLTLQVVSPNFESLKNSN